uniref:ribosomal maturation YjgA family protein n=1 Tax=Trichocoleus desertorum TaxID=1481672 RepID=UPI0025B5733C|nr:DUF2809 domain-containing protein [Trichocoleus desertorum]
MPTPSHHDWMKYRIALFLGILAIAPLGYGVRFSKFGPAWFNDGAGSVAYEIFWIFLVAFFLPTASPLRIAVGVCLATSGLEFLQLWQPPWLQALRTTLPGRLVLGNTFTWSDFFSYFIGSFIGWLGLRSLRYWLRTTAQINSR